MNLPTTITKRSNNCIIMTSDQVKYFELIISPTFFTYFMKAGSNKSSLCNLTIDGTL